MQLSSIQLASWAALRLGWRIRVEWLHVAGPRLYLERPAEEGADSVQQRALNWHNTPANCTLFSLDINEVCCWRLRKLAEIITGMQ